MEFKKILTNHHRGDCSCDYVSASCVRQLLCVEEAEFQAVTMIHTLLLVNSAGCNCHKDKFNNKAPAYCKTASMNIVAVDATGDYHLLPNVCIFWWHVGRLCGFKSIPEDIHDIISNIQHYHL